MQLTKTLRISKVKVCHLTSVHPIDDVRIFVKECTSLAAHGYDVTLIACGDIAFEEVKNGVKRISLHVPVKNRLHRMLRRSREVYKKAVEVDADIYHFHDPELLLVGYRLKKSGKKVIFDSHEDVRSDISEKRYIPFLMRKILARVYGLLERYVGKRIDAIVTVTPHIVNKLIKINPKTVQIANFPVFEQPETFNSLEKNHMAFAGSISHTYLLQNVITALGQTAGIKLFLAGNADPKYLKMLKAIDGWNMVEYLGKISYDSVNNLYNHSLIGIACLGHTANVGFNQGSLGVVKFFEYMKAGMAIICTDSVLWKKIIDEENCGICVNPYNVNEISNAMQYLADNPDIAKKMGKNGQNAFRNKYNWSFEEKKLISLYQSLISKPTEK